LTELNIALTAVGGTVIVLGLLSQPLKRTVFAVPLLALLIGVLLGPQMLGLLHPHQWGDQRIILEQASRLTLCIGLMGVALRLPPNYFRLHWRSMAVLLVLGIPLMFLSTGLLAYLLLGLPLGTAMLVGAVVSPTDPIVATSIVTGNVAEKNLPERIRNMLSAESGANDGLAYPVVLLPVLLLTRPAHEAWLHWLGRIVLWEVGGAVLLGILLGLSAGYLLRWAETKKTIEQVSFLSITLALSLLTLGSTKLMGTDGILAVFTAGISFDHVVGGGERAKEESVQEAVNQFFTVPIFILFGLMLPWEQWNELGCGGPVLALSVLLLRRLPVMFMLKPLVPQLKDRRDVLFAGWFGPMGVAALFYAMMVLQRTGCEAAWTVGSLLVCSSLVAHGMTAAPFSRLYRRFGEDKLPVTNDYKEN